MGRLVLPFTLGVLVVGLLGGGGPLNGAGPLVVLDPGHAVKNRRGGIVNSGQKSPQGLWERDVVVRIAEKTEQYLEEAGYQVRLTRNQQQFWRIARGRRSDLRARVEEANQLKADAVVKIHCDWHRNPRVAGCATYYTARSSRRLARTVQRSLVQATGRPDGGVHRTRLLGVPQAAMPTILVEVGYLTNPEEERLLRDETFLDKIAHGVVHGLTEYFQSSASGGTAKKGAEPL
ncbi:MAG: N-acetylmuramoyl-L-alanine amidase [Elusimicrobia bacterium]|nr:N-acetylmuramoyl-L-alanine amidase [Elusimicrobiota bacterium]